MNGGRMIEVDPTLRLVIASVIIVIGSGLLSSYFMEKKKIQKQKP
ncbi:MAG: hypothetical protein ACE5J2_01775 [Nitrososphaerales archaeon]